MSSTKLRLLQIGLRRRGLLNEDTCDQYIRASFQNPFVGVDLSVGKRCFLFLITAMTLIFRTIGASCLRI